MTADSTLGLRSHLRKAASVGVGRVSAQALNFLVFPIALRYIGPAEFGAYSLLYTVSLMYGVVVGLGLSTALMSGFAPAEREPNGVSRLLSSCLSQQAVLGGSILLLGLALSPPVSRVLVGEASPSVLAILLVAEFLANHALILARWQVLTNRHAQVSVVTFARSVTYLLAAVVLVGGARWGILGLAVADLLADAVALGIGLWMAREHLTFGFRRHDLRETVRVGLPAAPDTIFFWLIVSLPLHVLRRSGNAEAAGAFGLAWRLAAPIDLLGNSLASGAARELLQGGAGPAVRRVYRTSVGLLGLGAVALGVFGPELLRVFFPRAFHPAMVPLPAIVVGLFFQGLYYFEWVGLSGSRRTIGLSTASGAAAFTGLVFFAGQGFRASAESAALGFAASLLTLWVSARFLRTGARLGRTALLLLVGLTVGVLVDRLAALPLAPVRLLAVKCAIMAGLIFAAVVAELAWRLRERRRETGQALLFHDIPTYAEAARLLSGGRRVLDIGCSEGFFLGEVAAPVRVGVERDTPRAAQGARDRPGVRFVSADAAALPFRPGTFDRVSLIGVLPYVEDPAVVVREAAAMVAAGGRLIVSTAADHPVFRLLSPHSYRHRLRYFSAEDVSRLLRDAGLSVDEAFTRGPFLAPLLAVAYAVPSLVDRRLLRSPSAIGPAGRWARALTNPIIRWEYESLRGPGYQVFVAGIKA